MPGDADYKGNARVTAEVISRTWGDLRNQANAIMTIYFYEDFKHFEWCAGTLTQVFEGNR